MWCYLVIAFFNWKIGIFQQTLVRVYCILKAARVNSVWYATKTVSYLGPQIWDLVPNEIKRNLKLSMLSNLKSEGGLDPRRMSM